MKELFLPGVNFDKEMNIYQEFMQAFVAWRVFEMGLLANTVVPWEDILGNNKTSPLYESIEELAGEGNGINLASRMVANMMARRPVIPADGSPYTYFYSEIHTPDERTLSHDHNRLLAYKFDQAREELPKMVAALRVLEARVLVKMEDGKEVVILELVPIRAPRTEVEKRYKPVLLAEVDSVIAESAKHLQLFDDFQARERIRKQEARARARAKRLKRKNARKSKANKSGTGKRKDKKAGGGQSSGVEDEELDEAAEASAELAYTLRHPSLYAGSVANFATKMMSLHLLETAFGMYHLATIVRMQQLFQAAASTAVGPHREQLLELVDLCTEATELFETLQSRSSQIAAFQHNLEPGAQIHTIPTL